MASSPTVGRGGGGQSGHFFGWRANLETFSGDGGGVSVKKHPVWMLYGCCAISRYNEDDMGWSLGLIPTYMGFLLSTINLVGS